MQSIGSPCAPLLVLLCGIMVSLPAQAEWTTELEKVYAPQLVPLLKKYCVDCHSGEEAEAELEINTFKSARAVFDGRETWQKVLARTRTSEMPPKDAEKPTKAERELLVKWLDSLLNEVNCQQPHAAGHVTVRRLNKIEYRNTIRDLIGIDYEQANDFPADDIGYGFDNIGDVMTLPPILLEKYLTAAEEIAEEAIVLNPSPPVVARKRGRDLSGAGNRYSNVDGARMLTTTGEISGTIKLPKPGEYELRIKAFEHHGGPEFTKMAVRFNDRELGVIEVKATEEKPGVYPIRTRGKAGEHRVAVAFLNDFYDEKNPNRDERDRNLIIESVEVVGPMDEVPILPESHRRIFFVSPDEKVEKPELARRILERLASRAFRRPATEEEVKRLLGICKIAHESGDSFEESIRLAMQAVLISPHFLFRIEADPPRGQPDRLLNDYELATRLSYFLWSSTPDDELLKDAFQGGLRDEIKLTQQVRRLLTHERSKALVDNFAAQWLQLRKFDEITMSKRVFPSFSDQLRADMRTETTMFFQYIARENRSVIELLNADYSFLNERLARHYGVPEVKGDSFRHVSLKDSLRSGLLTQGSILTVTSNPTRTSPVKRGKWILDNILGEPPPPPPPNVPELGDDDGETLKGSLRQRMEQHRVNPNCSVCHLRMDSLGFALENFDAIGSWRSFDGKHPIKPDGELPSGEKFSGPRELTKLLLDTKQAAFVRCLTEKMLIYACGRGLEYYDKCAVDKITTALEKDGFRFSTLVLEIVKSEPFQRQGTKKK